MSKGVVVYYTWSGKTRRMAEIIAAQTGSELLEIQPKTPYSQNYNQVLKQAKEEIRSGHLPAIQMKACDFETYNVVYIGTPIWWGTMAPPVAAFLEAHDLSGKTVMPFSSHGGGGKGHSDNDIKNLCNDAKVMEMHSVYEGGGNSAEQGIAAWIKKNELSK